VSRYYDCADPEQRANGLAVAAAAVKRGELVVLPTDTVYGVGADAFTPTAIDALLAAKGRGRDMPVPVLVGSPRTVDGLAYGLNTAARDLIEAFWPGPLTVVVRQAPTLAWDLGDAAGTVALRMPLHPVAIELLRETGPMGVSSANRTGQPPATTAPQARGQLGDTVAVYLDGGRCEQGVPSAIVDASGDVPRLLRPGAIEVDVLRSVAPGLEVPGEAADGGDDAEAGAAMSHTEHTGGRE
jgi:tRNA threonylcarbamoyl adenosine modification protein (Sua5/YciO/YrdC/YwlC family)